MHIHIHTYVFTQSYENTFNKNVAFHFILIFSISQFKHQVPLTMYHFRSGNQIFAKEGQYPEWEAWDQSHIASVFTKSKDVLSCRHNIFRVSLLSWLLRISQELDRKEKKLPHGEFSSDNPLLFPLQVSKLTQHQQLLQCYPMPSDTKQLYCSLTLRVMRLSGNLILSYQKKEK